MASLNDVAGTDPFHDRETERTAGDTGTGTYHGTGVGATAPHQSATGTGPALGTGAGTYTGTGIGRDSIGTGTGTGTGSGAGTDRHTTFAAGGPGGRGTHLSPATAEAIATDANHESDDPMYHRHGPQWGLGAPRPRRSSRRASAHTDTDATLTGRRGSNTDPATRRASAAVRRASIGDPTIFHANTHESGWRGLFANRRTFLVALFASLGGLLYGYNQGVFGQVQVMREFYYRYESTLNINNSAPKKGMLTAILELGAFVGALMAGPLADRYSRKYSISGWCVVFIMGTIIQVAANRDVACIYAGRWFAGMGVGALSMLVPMWNAEVASPGIRGALVALQQLAITFGILVSYWIAYGTNYIGGTDYDPVTQTGQSTAAWRIPLGLQLVPAIILCIGACFLPFSPRWLMLKGRERECLDTLCYLRNGQADNPLIDFEFKSLQAERLAEKRGAEERYGVATMTWRTSWKEYRRILTTKPLLHRLLIGAGAQALQQWTGINAVIYYAPTIFQQLGMTGNTSSLLATGVVGIVNFVFTIPAVMYVDLVGRRPGMIWGASNMAISHAAIAAIIAVYGDRFGSYKSAGNGAIFMVYWFIVNFAITWGPLAWIVSAEVWPLQYRSRGMSISSATNWIMNFTVAEVTPVMISNIGWKTYIVFMCFCMVAALWAIFLLPELKGLSLEQVDKIFGDTSGAEDIRRRELAAQEVGLDKAAAAAGLEGGEHDGMGHDGEKYRHSDVEGRVSHATDATRHSGTYTEKDKGFGRDAGTGEGTGHGYGTGVGRDVEEGVGPGVGTGTGPGVTGHHEPVRGFNDRGAGGAPLI